MLHSTDRHPRTADFWTRVINSGCIKTLWPSPDILISLLDNWLIFNYNSSLDIFKIWSTCPVRLTNLLLTSISCTAFTESQSHLNLSSISSCNIGDGPTRFFSDWLFLATQQVQEARECRAVKNNLCLHIIPCHNVPNSSQCRWHNCLLAVPGMNTKK